MARIEPGLYEPSDDVRVFDGAEDDVDDEGSRLPLLIVIALLVLAAFAGVVWLAYSQGVQRGRQDVPRVIAAMSGPVKSAPANPGGTQSPYSGLKIYQQQAPADAGDKPLPSIITPPGEPMFSAWGPKHHPEAEQNAPQQQVAQSAPAPQAAVPAAAPAKAEPPPVKVAQTSPPPQAARKPAVHEPAPVTKTPPPAQQAPAKAPAQAAPVIRQAAVEKPAAAASAGGAYVLQIGSFKSESEAQAGWAAYRSRHAGLVGGLSPSIVSVDLGAKGTWYRVRVGAFGDRDAANAFCARLKADGGSCFPAKG
ncbi:MAG: SPOR domain-containing protein [Alphaproteobacteria bacterium]|jgi:cell division protein FtsN|nr:SPOR domain-containing protein [Alphaproteobacteria bacterium]